MRPQAVAVGECGAAANRRRSANELVDRLYASSHSLPATSAAAAAAICYLIVRQQQHQPAESEQQLEPAEVERQQQASCGQEFALDGQDDCRHDQQLEQDENARLPQKSRLSSRQLESPNLNKDSFKRPQNAHGRMKRMALTPKNKMLCLLVVFCYFNL